MKPLLLFDMDGTLIILKHRPKYRGTITYHTPFMSLKARMKEIAVSPGVPPEEIKDMNRMAHIWNRVRSYWRRTGGVRRRSRQLSTRSMGHSWFRSGPNISSASFYPVPLPVSMP